MKLKVIRSFGSGYVAYVNDESIDIIDQIVFYDDMNAPYKRYGFAPKKEMPFIINLNTKASTLPRHKAFKPTKHTPYLLIGTSYSYSRLYIPLSITIKHEILPQTQKLMVEGDYYAVYKHINVQLTENENSVIHIKDGPNPIETEQSKKRSKLLEELKEKGAYSLTDWDLKQILKHYKIVKRRTPLEY